nr:H-NS histone family protein [Burkholderia ambifaria]
MESYKDLKVRLDDLKAKIESAREAEIREVIAEIRAKVGEYMLVPEDVFPFLHENGRRRVVPKYMDPKTGATWCGRGRPPKWIADAEDWGVFLLKGVTD